MTTGKLMIEPSLHVGELKITPIVNLRIAQRDMRGVSAYIATKEPVYMIFSSHGEIKSLDIYGREVPIHLVKSELSACCCDQKELQILQLP